MSGNDMTERELDEALARIAGRPAPPPLAVTEARPAASGDLTDRELDEALARISGRTAPPSRARDMALATADDAAATPWRAAVHWDSRDALAAAEAELAGLYVSRRGESRTAAVAHVERLLREAWWRPAREEWASTASRFGSVTNALADELDRMRNTPPIAPPRPPVTSREAFAPVPLRPVSNRRTAAPVPPRPARARVTIEESGSASWKGEPR